MMLLEEASRREIRPEIQIFASDLDDAALAFGREGCYPLAIETDVSEERLRRFFSRESDQYRVTPELRGVVLFDALYGARERIRVIHPRHEQTSAYMALGAALATEVARRLGRACLGFVDLIGATPETATCVPAAAIALLIGAQA